VVRYDSAQNRPSTCRTEGASVIHTAAARQKMAPVQFVQAEAGRRGRRAARIKRASVQPPPAPPKGRHAFAGAERPPPAAYASCYVPSSAVVYQARCAREVVRSVQRVAHQVSAARPRTARQPQTPGSEPRPAASLPPHPAQSCSPPPPICHPQQITITEAPLSPPAHPYACRHGHARRPP